MKLGRLLTLCVPGEDGEVGKQTLKHFKDLGIDGRIVLNRILGKDIRTRMAVYLLRIGFKYQLL
jgi:hypothetical protein